MIWPKTYEKTADLWQEGNEIEVKAKVRVRDERVQISCDDAWPYKPPQEKEPTTTAKATSPEAPVQTEATSTPPRERHLLVINIPQTSNEDSDIVRLNRIVAALKIFPGKDEVQLNIANGEEVINLRLSNIHTDYCPELRQRLVEIVGEDGIRVETYQ